MDADLLKSAAVTPRGACERAVALLVEGGFAAISHRAVAKRAGLPLAVTTCH